MQTGRVKSTFKKYVKTKQNGMHLTFLDAPGYHPHPSGHYSCLSTDLDFTAKNKISFPGNVTEQ